MKLIDAFIFNAEFDLLEARLDYYRDIVDYFVIVEGNRSFSGIDKELSFPKSIERYVKHLHKIIYRPFDINCFNTRFDHVVEGQESQAWYAERAQRNYITTALSLFNGNDMLLLGDVDEFPDKRALKAAMELISNGTEHAVGFVQKMFYYNLNQYMNSLWQGTILCRMDVAQNTGTQWIRDRRCYVTPLHNGGWHLSCWMTAEEIKKKLESFSHQEYNKYPYTDIEFIKNQMAQGKDIIARDFIEMIPYDRTQADPEFLGIIEKFEKK